MCLEPRNPNGVDLAMLFPTAINVILQTLDHHHILACLVGELALNYYNVPDVVHDVEICVPDDAVGDVSTILSYTGLFKKEGYKNLNAHNEYKSGCLRLVTTAWLHRPVSFVVFPASFYGLQPLDAHTFRPCEHVKSDSEFSKEILDTVHERDVRNWRFPRLAPYIASLAKRYLETGDDMAAMAVEHLVDGLDLSETWYDQQMDKETPMEVTGFVTRLIRGKKSRIAYYQEHKVTCMIADEEQASKLTRIPGYQW